MPKGQRVPPGNAGFSWRCRIESNSRFRRHACDALHWRASDLGVTAAAHRPGLAGAARPPRRVPGSPGRRAGATAWPSVWDEDQVRNAARATVRLPEVGQRPVLLLTAGQLDALSEDTDVDHLSCTCRLSDGHDQDWRLSRCGRERFRMRGFTGRGVGVAIIDSGVGESQRLSGERRRGHRPRRALEEGGRATPTATDARGRLIVGGGSEYPARPDASPYACGRWRPTAPAQPKNAIAVEWNRSPRTLTSASIHTSPATRRRVDRATGRSGRQRAVEDARHSRRRRRVFGKTDAGLGIAVERRCWGILRRAALTVGADTGGWNGRMT